MLLFRADTRPIEHHTRPRGVPLRNPFRNIGTSSTCGVFLGMPALFVGDLPHAYGLMFL